MDFKKAGYLVSPRNDKGHFLAQFQRAARVALLRPLSSAMSLPQSPVLLLYVAGRALKPFIGLTAILLFALVLERVLSLVQVVTELGAPLYTVGELVTYLIPHYLGLALPAAWFLGVLIGFRGLQRDSELTVMRASGLALRQLLVPLCWVSLGLAVVMAILTGYLQPLSRYAYRETLHELKRKDFWSKLQPGVFTPVAGAQGVIRVGASSDNGHQLEDLFASYQQAGQKQVFISAKRAVIKAPESGRADSDTQLDLFDGMVMTVTADDQAWAPKQVVSLYFEVFPWSLSDTGLLPPYGLRGQDEREMTFGELLTGEPPAEPVDDSPARRMTEWHSRLVKCVSLPVLAVLAAPLALLGRGRTSRSYGSVIGIVLLVLYQKILGTGEAYGKLGELPPAFAAWFPWVGLAVLAAILFHWCGGDRDKPRIRAARAAKPT